MKFTAVTEAEWVRVYVQHPESGEKYYVHVQHDTTMRMTPVKVRGTQVQIGSPHCDELRKYARHWRAAEAYQTGEFFNTGTEECV